MLPFSTLLLRKYYEAIGWNEDNLYSNITRSSAALIDFPVPDSLLLQLANAPTPIFFTSYALDALPQLNGSLNYVTTSEPLVVGPSRSMPFREVVERFRVYPTPTVPQPKAEIWQGGRRIEGRDYLLYSRLHLPTMHLSGLACTRIAPTLNAQVAFVHQPARLAPPSTARQAGDAPPKPQPVLPPGNVLLSLQHDTGRYSGEYTYSAADAMFGFRGLYNFGWNPEPREARSTASGGEATSGDSKVRVDEEEMMDGGLRGRFSAGGEVFFSIKQKSLGVSTGVRFTTLPPAAGPNAPPPSPPTTITVLYNPLIGFLSTAYAAQVSPNVSLATRFGVNVYSYESDFAIGGEWWVGRRRGRTNGPVVEMTPEDRAVAAKRRTLGGRLRDSPDDEVDVDLDFETTPTPVEPDEVHLAHLPPGLARARMSRAAVLAAEADARERDRERDGVLKARLSGNWSLALLYESRVRNCLVSVGLITDLLSGTGNAIRSVGLEVQYYS